MRKIFIALLFLTLIAFEAPAIFAQDPPPAFRATNFPLPRFVSVSAEKAFVRAGPGRKYPILWVYRQKGLPVEITLEYGNWRKIRDFDGEEGWVHTALLSGRRTAFVLGQKVADIFRTPHTEARITARTEPGALVSVISCELGWCRIEADSHKGWIQQNLLWGVYENENFD